MTIAPKLRGERVLVVGLGKSGVAAARLLVAQGATVLGNDRREESEIGDAIAGLRERGVELHLGGHDAALFTQVDRIVVSPGVPPLAELEAAEEAGVPVASEVELASWFFSGTVIAVTGTNGKSTVTSLLGAMAAAADVPTFVGGNLGTPLTDAVGTAAAGPGGLVIVEVSSFQLERVDRFRANVAVLLNVTDDHLDRYPSFGAYAAAKGRVFAGQRREDHAVVPEGDALCESLARAGSAKVHRFGPLRAKDGVLRDDRGGSEVALDALPILGAHNRLNASAAVLAARLAGIPPEAIAKGLRDFRGLPHRMERVAEHEGVVYFDDSKATNVGAAVAALESFADGRKVVLIAGGVDKGGSYAPLVQALAETGRAVVTLGEAAPLIEAALDGVVAFVRCADMDAALAEAARLAEPGDVVLLAPACSSFDMFGSYAERGDVFQRAVHSLAGANASVAKGGA